MTVFSIESKKKTGILYESFIMFVDNLIIQLGCVGNNKPE
jgi:hypothetical protein